MQTKPLADTLRSYVESHYPILYLVTPEDAQADTHIHSLAGDRKIIEWNMARGLVAFDTKLPYVESNYQDLAAALLHFLEQDIDQLVIVIRDAHLALKESPVAVSRLRALARQILQRANQNAHITVFLVAPVVLIPPELEKLITLFDLPLPDEDAISALIQQKSIELDAPVDENTLAQLAMAFQGLTHYEIDQLLQRSYQSSGDIGVHHIPLIQDEKSQIIQKSGVLELVKTQGDLSTIGGLKNLKAWLRQKQKVLSQWQQARAFGVELPKGIMVVGMPGCGKSLTAKATASLFKLPLLKMDMGSMMGKFVGDSEGNMRRALRVAEAVSPCVLWVDEVEKAFAGIGVGNVGSEVATRMFGYFLTWMQEKSSQVFVIATANDVSALPPELMRKGRFDEIFYVDFPLDTERKEIFKLHLEKRKRLNDQINLDELVNKTEHYSGADIEAVVKEAIESCFVSPDPQKSLKTEHLLKAIKSTQPLGKVMEDQVTASKKRFEKMMIKKAS